MFNVVSDFKSDFEQSEYVTYCDKCGGNRCKHCDNSGFEIIRRKILFRNKENKRKLEFNKTHTYTCPKCHGKGKVKSGRLLGCSDCTYYGGCNPDHCDGTIEETIRYRSCDGTGKLTKREYNTVIKSITLANDK